MNTTAQMLNRGHIQSQHTQMQRHAGRMNGKRQRHVFHLHTADLERNTNVFSKGFKWVASKVQRCASWVKATGETFIDRHFNKTPIVLPVRKVAQAKTMLTDREYQIQMLEMHEKGEPIPVNEYNSPRYEKLVKPLIGANGKPIYEVALLKRVTKERYDSFMSRHFSRSQSSVNTAPRRPVGPPPHAAEELQGPPVPPPRPSARRPQGPPAHAPAGGPNRVGPPVHEPAGGPNRLGPPKFGPAGGPRRSAETRSFIMGPDLVRRSRARRERRAAHTERTVGPQATLTRSEQRRARRKRAEARQMRSHAEELRGPRVLSDGSVKLNIGGENIRLVFNF